jgi:hypothetical protein
VLRTTTRLEVLGSMLAVEEERRERAVWGGGGGVVLVVLRCVFVCVCACSCIETGQVGEGWYIGI